MEIAGVNVTKGLSMYGGRAKIYTELLKEFCTEGESKHDAINTCFLNKDIPLYTTYVHGLRGSADAICAEELSKAAKLMEDAGNREDWDYISEFNDELLQNYEKTIENVAKGLSG